MGPLLDRYEDITFVAQGGMARVYRGRRRDTGAVVGVREISGGPDSEDRIASERRGAEIQRALCAIDPRVPKVFDVFTSADGWLYVEVEFVEGEDLSAIMQRGPLPVADAARIASELFDFLRLAHSTAVSVDGERRDQQVHGDLTPRNIRVAPDGAVRILDFGIAKGLKATVTAATFANYGYVSPERARSGRMGVSDDFWSAGIVIYEMLSGQRAFAGTQEEIAAALAERRSPPPLDGRIPVPLRLIVAKLLAWDPAYRYRDATAVLADLTAFQQQLPTRAEAEADAAKTRVVGPPKGGGPPQGEPYAGRTTPVVSGSSRTTNSPTRGSHYDGPTISIGSHADSRTTVIAPPTRPAAPPKPRTSRRVLVRAGIVAMVALLVLHERSVWNTSQRLSRQAATDAGDLERLWSDYEELNGQAWFSGSTRGLARTLVDRFVTEASTTLKDYRQDEPIVRERHVETARSQLARAVQLQPNNDRAQAWLRYAQGHLARMAGDNARGDERRLAWRRAAALFEESARLAPDLPDPYLGLARLYTHRDHRDPERARRAMDAAARLGHPPGVREHAQLGDLSRDEADVLYRQARSVRGTGSEEPLLVRARAELGIALNEYEQSKGFGQTNTRIKEINDVIRRIDVRLDAIRGAPPQDEEPAIEVTVGTAEELPNELGR